MHIQWLDVIYIVLCSCPFEIWLYNLLLLFVIDILIVIPILIRFRHHLTLRERCKYFISHRFVALLSKNKILNAFLKKEKKSLPSEFR